jgi:hypothetical protein
MARDPRSDPRPGDQVRDGDGRIWRVRAREGEMLKVAIRPFCFRMSLTRWQKWCRLNVAEPDAPPPLRPTNSKAATKLFPR